MRSLCHVQVARLGHLNLLHVIIVRLDLIIIIVKELLASSHFLLVESWIDPNLVA